MIAWGLVQFAVPAAGGSGIPQVMASIERAATDAQPTPSLWDNVKLIFVKVSSSFGATLGGGILGREGPTIQISAAIFELFDRAFRTYISSRRSREALLIAGGAAGLAAAFNTPLGGVVFAIEELGSQHFKAFKGTLILAVVTAGYVTQAILGPYLFIGHPTIGPVLRWDAVVGLLAALVVGALAAGFGSALFHVQSAVKRLSPRRRLVLAVVVGLTMSGVCVGLGADASGGGSLLIRKLLFDGPEAAAHVGLDLAAWRVVGLLLTYVAGCAGGVFAPSLAAGAAIGAVVVSSVAVQNPNLVIVMSMIAFLTGVTRSPFTAFILVFEMTDRQAAVVPMMAAALLANGVARLVSPESFYERMRDILLRGDDSPGASHKLS